MDTKGRAYAKVLQQLMTGVYISEVCLIGLFAINTAPGPIILMAIFLFGTAIYHALMRHALKPLMEYLPESYEGDEGKGATTLFSTTDHKSYDASKADGAGPTEASVAQSPTKKKMTAKKANLFTKMWDPRKFKSHGQVPTMVPNYPPPKYEQEDEKLAYYNPITYSKVPNLWIARDEMGISTREVRETREVCPITDEFAYFNEKNKIVWRGPEDEGGARLEDVPIWEKRVDY